MRRENLIFDQNHSSALTLRLTVTLISVKNLTWVFDAVEQTRKENLIFDWNQSCALTLRLRMTLISVKNLKFASDAVEQMWKENLTFGFDLNPSPVLTSRLRVTLISVKNLSNVWIFCLAWSSHLLLQYELLDILAYLSCQ
nr:hypothetical protein BaRGS_012619 [Batillaria attramentaria]